MVGGEEGERVGSCVPGSIMARQKPRSKKKKAWLVGQELCVTEGYMQLERLAWTRSDKVLAVMERNLDFATCTKDSQSQISPDNTNNQWFLIGILGKPIASNKNLISN